MSANFDTELDRERFAPNRDVASELEEIEVREAYDSLIMLRDFVKTNFSILRSHWNIAQSRREIVILIEAHVYPHLPYAEREDALLRWQSYAAIIINILATAEQLGNLDSINRENIYARLLTTGVVPLAESPRDVIENPGSRSARKRAHSPESQLSCS